VVRVKRFAYQPGEATAYESIRFLTIKVPFGWLIRSVHSWSAHLMIISSFFGAVYVRPFLQKRRCHRRVGVDIRTSEDSAYPSVGKRCAFLAAALCRGVALLHRRLASG